MSFVNSRLRKSSLTKSFMGGLNSLKVILRDPLGAIGLALVTFFILLSLLAPSLAPYGPFEVVHDADRKIVRLVPPNMTNLLGTTNQGMDVLSQTLYGSRIALLVGVLSAFGSAVIGTLIGLFSGYYGGWVDQISMRITDVAFGIPYLPFVLIVISITGPSLFTIILLIIFFLWRVTARVIRSQVLSLRERPFVWAAKTAGASDARVMFTHILPNILPFSFLYMALGVSSGVMMEAALSFLGFGDPMAISWGQMLNLAFTSGAIRTAWWWVLPPGLCLSFFVTSSFLITRSYEEVINPRLREI